MKVSAVLLDVNGTLFSPLVAAPVFEELGLPATSLQSWFDAVLRDAFAAQLAGVFCPFIQFSEHHLASLSAKHGIALSQTPADAARSVAEAWKAAKPYPDVGLGLSNLQFGGIKVAALTNGSTAIASAVLARAGLELAEVTIMDVGEFLAWKPDPAAYRSAANALLLPASEVMMVASHAWDVHGALQAGLQACYVQREGCEDYPAFLDQPMLTVKSFEELADKLLLSE